MNILLVINNLSPGTGPFQRIIKFNKAETISVVSLYDDQATLESIAIQFGTCINHVKLFGLDSNNRFDVFLKLYKLVRLVRPDIIQSVHTYTDVACLLIKYLTKIPVVSFEGTLVTRWSFPKKYIVLFIHSLMDAVVCVSHNTRKVNSNASLFFNKISNRCTIYNGVDLDLIDSLQIKKTVTDIITIGYTGDLKPVKNLIVLFHALSKCYKYKIKLLIIGSGSQYNSLKKLSSDLNLNVEFTGQTTRLDVLKKLNLMDIFVMPSLVEGLSESIVQAMASRVPVIASDINSNKELIIHNETGLLFESGNADSLAYEISKIINKVVDVEMILNNARMHVEKNLNIHDITDKYIKLYLALIK